MKILSFLNYASKEVLSHFSQDEIVNIGSFYDERLKQKFYKCELGTESYVLALFCTMLNLSEFDIGELSAESCFGEEEASEILEFLKSADLILLDSNLLYHKDKNIYYFASKLAKYFDLKLMFDYELKDVELVELDDNNGLILYECLDNDDFIVSPAFANLARIKEFDFVEIKTKTKTLKKKVKIDNSLKGLFALSKKDNAYAFSPCVVKGVSNEN